MLTMRFPGLRTLIGVAVLSLALVAGIVGTTEPAAALDSDPNQAEMMCDMMDGTLYSYFEDKSVSGANIWVTDCFFEYWGHVYMVRCEAVGSPGNVSCRIF